MITNELTKPISLIETDGTINLGWSRKPVFDLNLEKAHFMKIKALQKFRAKKWDYYYVFTDKFFFSVTLADIGYLGTAFIYFYEYESNTITEDTIIIPFASKFVMARNSDSGRTCFENKKLSVDFKVDKKYREVYIYYPTFNEGEGLEAQLRLFQGNGLESICVVTPIEKDKMNYTHKICCMPVEGYIRRGEKKTQLKVGKDLGGLDWSRGFLSYRTFWNWACTSAYQGNHTLGLNLCYGLNDTKDTENAFFVDGKCQKVDTVIFDYDKNDLMKKWTVLSSDKRVSLNFIPDKERIAKTDMKLIKSEVHQLFGHFNGELVLDDGSRFTIENIRGAIEEHHARW